MPRGQEVLAGRGWGRLLAPLAAVSLAIGAVWAVYAIQRETLRDPSAGQALLVMAFAASGLILAAAIAVARHLSTQFGRAGRTLSVAVAAMARGERCCRLDPAGHSPLSALAESINALAGCLEATRGEIGTAVGTATAGVEHQKAMLAALLNDLHEGVVVCNLKHQVVLYNQIALGLLHVAGQMGLGRPLFGLIARDPLVHAFELLVRRPADEPGNAPFVAGTVDGRSLLFGRMSLVRVSGEITGYVATFYDATDSVAALARRDSFLRELVEGLQASLRRLDRGESAEAIAAIRTSVEQADVTHRLLLAGWWPMADTLSADLFDFVVRRLDGSGLRVNRVGLPVWLHCDSHTLVLALEALVRAVAASTGADCFDLAAESTGVRGRVRLTWRGVSASAGALAEWKESEISPALGGMTVADMLAHHTRVEVRQSEAAGRVSIEIALSLGHDDHDRMEPAADRSSRPEFFDFDLLAQRGAGDRGEVGLREVTYVVFDTETTGLEPTRGDQIVSIAGVRIVNGRILTGETFGRLVNPGRPIPAESVRFHGISDQMVIDKPPLTVVLPQFKAFAADAVLVGHNVAFDLKFIRLREAESGVAFDHTVLDTMLLSSFVDGTAENQSLDAIAGRYGIPVTGRHTALGDALVTAAVLLRLIEALEQKGIRTLGQALSTLNMTWELHNRMLTTQ